MWTCFELQRMLKAGQIRLMSLPFSFELAIQFLNDWSYFKICIVWGSGQGIVLSVCLLVGERTKPRYLKGPVLSSLALNANVLPFIHFQGKNSASVPSGNDFRSAKKKQKKHTETASWLNSIMFSATVAVWLGLSINYMRFKKRSCRLDSSEVNR